MLKIRLLTVAICLCFAIQVSAQNFSNILGKADPREFGNTITQQLDSTYLVGGSYRNSFYGKDFPACIHLRKNGSYDWARQYNLPGQPDAEIQYVEAVRNTTGNKDGYIALIGASSSIFVARLNNNGTVAWGRKLTKASPSMLVQRIKPVYSSATSTPSFYVLASDYNSDEQLVIKLSATGTTIWQKRIGHNTTGNEYIFRDLKVTSDSGCVITGYVSEGGLSKPVIFKMSSTGSVTLAKVYDFFSTAYSGGFGIAPTTGGYVVTGEENNGDDNLTFKVTTAGAITWAYKYTNVGVNELNGQAVVSDAAGNIIVAGANYNPSVLNDAFIMKLNSLGTVTFAKEYYGHSDVNDLKLTIQGGYAFAGTSDPSNVLSDIYVVHTNSSGNLASACQPASMTYTRVSPEFNSVVNASYYVGNSALTNSSVIINSPSITTEEVRCGTAAPETIIADKVMHQLQSYFANSNTLQVTLTSNATDKEKYEAKLMNMQGEIVGLKQISANVITTFQLPAVQSGLYVVTVSLRGQLVAQQKLIYTK